MGYKCLKCNHTACQVRKDFARQCDFSGHIESATANILFQKVKFGVRRAFINQNSICKLYGCALWRDGKDCPTYYAESQRSHASSGNSPMDGDVHMDEFVLGGREAEKTGRSCDSKNKKAVTAVQLTKDGKVKRMNAMKIKDFSAHSLLYIFVKHICWEAKVTTDK